jgi:small-conductance mechanosensitive channel
MWENIKQISLNAYHFFDSPIFSIGDSDVSALSISYFIGATILVFVFATQIKRLFVKKIFPRYHVEIGLSEAVATIIKYVVTILGLIIVLDFAGIDLSSLKLIAGALGVGIGFGLQNIVNNFVSGLIILFERPIKVGDRIEVGGVNGDVVKIAARATTVVTNDNISIIVPNSQFTSNSVTNWSHDKKVVRFNYPVGVAYKEDPERIKKALLEVANANAGVLKNPYPDVLFDSYGDNAINFNLRVWTIDYLTRPGVLRSQLYYAIFEKFKEMNIEIPFPQRDLRMVLDNTKTVITDKKA